MRRRVSIREPSITNLPSALRGRGRQQHRQHRQQQQQQQRRQRPERVLVQVRRLEVVRWLDGPREAAKAGNGTLSSSSSALTGSVASQWRSLRAAAKRDTLERLAQEDESDFDRSYSALSLAADLVFSAEKGEEEEEEEEVAKDAEEVANLLVSIRLSVQAGAGARMKLSIPGFRAPPALPPLA